METLDDIKTYICDMVVYCDVISSKDSSIQSKIGFASLMGKVAKMVAEKCDILEKELENEQEKTNDNKSVDSQQEVQADRI
jgi:NDP-sugar pyrophosphorylase family protein